MGNPRNNLCVQVAVQELEAAGVAYDVQTTSKHVHIHYGDKLQHLHVVAATPSDRRAHLNERACIRRDLEAFGYIERKTDLEARPEPVVSLKGGEARCYSQHIAEHFGKAHKDVLRAIDRVREDCGLEFDQRNFAPVEYLDARGRTYRAYEMTRDGFSLVVMGFTGEAATRWKVRYIEAFNALATELARVASADEVASLRSDIEAVTGLLADIEARATAHRPQRQMYVRAAYVRRAAKAGARQRRAG